MSIWDWAGIIGLSGICIFAGVMVFWGWRPITKLPPHIKANIRTEKRLLQSILDDIENNHSDWIAVPYDMGMQREPHLINDKKNMAILISNDQVIIKMNLKAAHKYRESAEETIATTVKGKHVTKFIKAAEGLIDTRGKELSFIEDMLNRRL